VGAGAALAYATQNAQNNQALLEQIEYLIYSM
jgi:hypothetical protein